MASRPFARHWCFTYNNPAHSELDLVDLLEASECTYAVFQLEVGEQGTPHFQGYVAYDIRRTLTTMKAVLHHTVHWEIARGTPAQNRTYCTKPDGRIGEFCEIGLFPEKEQGKRTDLLALHSALKDGLGQREYRDEFFDLFVRYPNLVQNYSIAGIEPRDEKNDFSSWLIVGPPGTGKSRLAFELAKRLGGGTYRHTATKWFDGYRGERTIIFDDFRGSSLPFTLFKSVVDRYPFRVEFKGTSCEMAATNFIFTSNTEPDTWWKEEVTGPELDAIYRRCAKKVIHFRALNQFSLYPSYIDYARTVLVPRQINAEEVQTPIQTLVYEQEEGKALILETLL